MAPREMAPGAAASKMGRQPDATTAKYSFRMDRTWQYVLNKLGYLVSSKNAQAFGKALCGAPHRASMNP